MPQPQRGGPAPPERIAGLAAVAANLSWSWNRNARALFRMLDPALWRRTQHNPIELLRRIDPSQELDGIVLRATPQRGIEHAEQRPRVAVPTPRQVGGNGGEPCDPFGGGGAAALGLRHPACKLRPVGAAWEAVGHL